MSVGLILIVIAVLLPLQVLANARTYRAAGACTGSPGDAAAMNEIAP